MARYILGIDQGTTRTKASIFNHDAEMVAGATQEIQRFYPQPGWVEQDPHEILAVTLGVVSEALKNGRVTPEEIEAIGITNQSQTTIFWNKHTGEAVGRAILWQDTRTVAICSRLTALAGAEIKARSGRSIIPNAAATKIKWLMENDRAIQHGIARGELCFGTVDAWLVWKLTGGKSHVTDLSNAAITLLVNAYTLNYDDWILNLLGIPYEILPELRSSSEIYAYTDPAVFFGVRVPIAAVVSDLTASLAGTACFEKDMLQCNFGTGSSLIINTGSRMIPANHGLSPYILWATEQGAVRGLGGWTNISGAAIQWLRDELGLIRDGAEAEVLANRVADTGGVYFVPAFTGLGSPNLDYAARGSLFGITQSTSKGHIVRAALEAMAFQIRDIYEVLAHNHLSAQVLRASGGTMKNEFLFQFLADILSVPVDRPAVLDSSLLGAVFLAGLGIGYWESVAEVTALCKIERRFEPHMPAEKREALYAGWKKAVQRSAGWLNN
jgi:glycerol kinase